MAGTSRLPDHRYRLAGCFLPQDVELLDLVYKEVLRELTARGLHEPGEGGSAEMRGWVAALIISNARTRRLDFVRLKELTLAALGEQGSPLRKAG
jgi:hypothetical protein